MAGVNGVEIKVGQVWRCRDGQQRKVVGNDGHHTYPWDLSGGASVDIDGCESANDFAEDCDLIELVKDESGFTIWRGGEQPAETRGETVDWVARNPDAMDAPWNIADKMDWSHTDNPGDIVAYKVVEEAPQADSATLAEETLSALGWTFDGQAWIESGEITMAPNALDVQVGGSHYKDMTIQPWAAFDSWLSTEQHVGYLLGTAIAYLARFNSKGVGKGGLVDVEKATHTLQRLVEVAKKGSANG